MITSVGRRDSVEIMVEARVGADLDQVRPKAAAELAKSIKDRIGLTAAVTVKAPGEIERSQGKARRVIDRRPKA